MECDVEIGTSVKGMLVVTVIEGSKSAQAHVGEKQALCILRKITESLPQMRENHNEYA